MVKIWYRDLDESNPSDLHQTDPAIFLQPGELLKRTGVKYTKVSDDILDDEDQLMTLRKNSDYQHYDWLEIIPDTSEKYTTLMNIFYTEHLHEDPEIRLITAGSGYFEIRDVDDKWIRVQLSRGDLIDLPPGVYHRFTLPEQGYIKMIRLFSEIPKWKAVNRCDADGHPARTRYHEFMKQYVVI